jgi:hypothetical protein
MLLETNFSKKKGARKEGEGKDKVRKNTREIIHKIGERRPQQNKIP